MKVSAINSVKSSTVFTSNKKNKEVQHTTSPMNAAKAVPVMVLMAMNPSLLNANMPVINPESNTIEYSVSDKPEIEEATYVMAPELQGVQQHKAPDYGWEYLKHAGIYHDAPATWGYVKGRVLYVGPIDVKNEINDVYLIDPNDAASPEVGVFPPTVRRLIYHNLPDDKDFCSAIIDQNIISDEGEYINHVRREVRLDRKTAQDLIFVVHNKTQFDNHTGIRFEQTDSPRMHSFMELNTR